MNELVMLAISEIYGYREGFTNRDNALINNSN